MSQILVRNLSKSAVDRLKKRARGEGRSLQSEAKIILERAAEERPDREAVLKKFAELRARFKRRDLPDMVQLIREERDER
jgi:plasmid stability protein